MKESLAVPEQKKDYNATLFRTVAPKYDFITRALSFGRDSSWKRLLISRLPDIETPTGPCVDLAAGTGDISMLLATRYQNTQIIGLDLTPEMLDIARARHGSQPNLTFQEGDMCQLPMADNSVELITGGYALRNAPDLNTVISEVYRVLKPGGQAAFLDFSKPANRVIATMEHIALRVWGNLWGLILHGNPDVYGYIAESLATFPDHQSVKTVFENHHFSWKEDHACLGGVLRVFIVQKGNE